MADLEGFKSKFLLFKFEDINRYLDRKTMLKLDAIRTTIAKRIEDDKKKENKYLVINTEEPYADEIIEIMKRHGHWG